jgi:hypothetical protein
MTTQHGPGWVNTDQDAHLNWNLNGLYHPQPPLFVCSQGGAAADDDIDFSKSAAGWGKPKQPLSEDASTTEKAADKAANVMEDAAEDAVQKLHPALIKFLNR